jgi:hypothetical protein
MTGKRSSSPNVRTVEKGSDSRSIIHGYFHGKKALEKRL